MHDKLSGYELAGETTISWGELALFWLAITEHTEDANTASEGVPLTVLRIDADVWHHFRCTDSLAVEQLQQLVRSRMILR